MTIELQTISTPEDFLEYGSRPVMTNQKTGEVKIRTNRGILVNSLLTKDEWESLERKVYDAAVIRLNIYEHLRTKGLIISEDFGTIVSQWNEANEMTAANFSITGQAGGERDRVDFALKGVTVPVVFKEFTIPTRQLRAARKIGNPLDTIHATAAGRVVAEGIESMIIDGITPQVDTNSTTYGITNHPNRNTDTIGNYGGGDFGTIANIVPGITGMINAAVGDRYYGPYSLYVAPTQYTQMTTSFYTDGSGESAANRVLRMPQVDAVFPNDTLADGEVVLVQCTEDVIDFTEQIPLSVVEWSSPDGSVGHFKVMFAGAPRVKADYADRSGIVHATGA